MGAFVGRDGVKVPNFLAVDFFCGAGGTTRGLRVGLEKASTISIPCETPGEQADVGDGYPGFC